LTSRWNLSKTVFYRRNRLIIGRILLGMFVPLFLSVACEIWTTICDSHVVSHVDVPSSHVNFRAQSSVRTWINAIANERQKNTWLSFFAENCSYIIPKKICLIHIVIETEYRLNCHQKNIFKTHYLPCVQLGLYLLLAFFQ
jgi:hypothetical protein